MEGTTTIQTIITSLALDTFWRTYEALGDPHLAQRNAEKDVRRICHNLRRNAAQQVGFRVEDAKLLIADREGRAA
jgi:signal transduction histidine kinase